MAILIPVLGTIVAAAVAAIVGTFAYRSQKETDRRAELRKQQRTAYENYFQSYFAWAMTEAGTPEEQENANKYKQAYFMLFTLASDNFLQHLS